MFILSVKFPIWTIDHSTFNSAGSSFSIDYGPFYNEQQAKWFWLTMKEKLQRKYESVTITDSEFQYQYYIEN